MLDTAQLKGGFVVSLLFLAGQQVWYLRTPPDFLL